MTSSTSLHDSDPEYELLNVEESDTPTLADMGYDEQFVKPEGRRGDVAAQWAAYISLGVCGSRLLDGRDDYVHRFVGLCRDDMGHHPRKQPEVARPVLIPPAVTKLVNRVFTYGILTLQPSSQAKTKAAGLTRHQLAMMILGVPAITLGTLAIIRNKSMHGNPHFTTWHGSIGIISVSWMVVQVVLGGGSVWFNGRLFGGNPKAKSVWKYHRLSGYIVFPLFLLTAYLGGAWSSWTTGRSPFDVRLLAYTISPIVLFAAILVRVRTSKMQFS
uniref:Cytochrome b561 domain-containing protein n=1 Tax=Polyporus umbellatus TaxID=158314 RepID=A0A0A1ETA8_9APHY|nr:hypothetical protein [Polyporus umbellatus]